MTDKEKQDAEEFNKNMRTILSKVAIEHTLGGDFVKFLEQREQSDKQEVKHESLDESLDKTLDSI